MSNVNVLGSFGNLAGDSIAYEKATRTVTHPSSSIDASLSDSFVYNCNSVTGIKLINISNLSDAKKIIIQVINNTSGEIRFALSDVGLTLYANATYTATKALTSSIFSFLRTGNNVYLTAINSNDFSIFSYNAGYFGGGYNPSLSNEIDGINFSTDTAFNPAATLAVARYGLAGVNSSTKGYFGGGFAGNYSNKIDGINFSTHTAINPSATLAVARYNLAGVNSSTKGYFGGGDVGLQYPILDFSRNEIDGINFSTDTAFNPSATLAVARNWLAGVNSSTKGYFGGGYTEYYAGDEDYFNNIKSTNQYSEIDGINFSTDTAFNPSATLAVTRYGLAGVNSSTKGYFGGGWAGNYSNEIDGITFATDTAINPAATLAVARYQLAGVNSSTKGYFGGGSTGTNSNEIDGIDFSTDTAINPAATLAVARSGLAGVQSGGIL